MFSVWTFHQSPRFFISILVYSSGWPVAWGCFARTILSFFGVASYLLWYAKSDYYLVLVLLRLDTVRFMAFICSTCPLYQSLSNLNELVHSEHFAFQGHSAVESLYKVAVPTSVNFRRSFPIHSYHTLIKNLNLPIYWTTYFSSFPCNLGHLWRKHSFW